MTADHCEACPFAGCPDCKYQPRLDSELHSERELMTDHNGQTCRCACHNGLSQPCDEPGGCGARWSAERPSDRQETAQTHDPVTKVARDLSAIEDLACHLAAEAEHRANDPEYLPGGNATVSLAAVANLEAWEHIFEAREARGLDTTHGSDEDDSWEPPLQTLCFWSEEWRREHGAEYDQRPTIASEANFIRYLLPWAWENEVRWEDFARDIRQARLRLEETLYAGRRVERSRVNCIADECERKPRLIKVYRSSSDDDFHKCPACKAAYTPQRYAMAKAELLASQDANRHVKYQDALNAIDRSARTFRQWVRFWRVRSYRDPLTGQVWVWWPDVRETDRDTPRRRRAESEQMSA